MDDLPAGTARMLEASKLRAEHAASGTAWTFEDWLSLHVVQLRAKVGSLPAETGEQK